MPGSPALDCDALPVDPEAMHVVLETDRLRLREIVPQDLDFLAELLGDPDVMRFYPNTLDRAGTARWLERQLGRYERDGHGFWIVEARETERPVGQVGLLNQRLEDGVHPEVAYLIHVPYQRRGYATEAALGVRDYAFQVLGKGYVVSFIRPENRPSRRVARKLGMRPRGTIRWAGLDHLFFRVERSEAQAAEPLPRSPPS
jgi:RimJ/RimL family protein N-acetyltransferase